MLIDMKFNLKLFLSLVNGNITSAQASESTSPAWEVEYNGSKVRVATGSFGFDSNNDYKASYTFQKISSDNPSNIQLYIDIIENGCIEGNGNSTKPNVVGCFGNPLTESDSLHNFSTINLNAANGYTH